MKYNKKTIIFAACIYTLALYGCDDNGGVSCTFEGNFTSLAIPGASGKITGTIGYWVLPHTAVCNWYDWGGRGCWPTLVTENYIAWLNPCLNKATELINKYLKLGQYNNLASLKIKTITISCHNKEKTCDVENNWCTRIR